MSSLPAQQRKRIPAHERVRRRIEKAENGCWLWPGAKTPRGYGKAGMPNGQTVYTHRVMYEHRHGAIPEGLTLDHLCRVRSCANPDHLEAVTHIENVRRGRATVYQCDHDDSEIYHHPVTGHRQYCRACKRDRARAAYVPVAQRPA